MKIDTLAVSECQTNCYIVRNDGAASCAVIDPGDDAHRILAFLEQEGLTLDAVLLTHGHFDHVGAVRALVQATGCDLWMSQGDYTQFKNPTADFLYPLANCQDMEVHFCEDGELIRAGGLDFYSMDTPGHSWGSVCYLCGDTMFCGDTLFAGSCGRIDLPGGDRETMLGTLERLAELETDYRLFPGHGSPTTLFYEKQTNPYLQAPLL